MYLQYTIKQHFYTREKFMRICQNGPLDKIYLYLCVLFLMHSKFMRPALDLHNLHKQIHQNLSCKHKIRYCEVTMHTIIQYHVSHNSFFMAPLALSGSGRLSTSFLLFSHLDSFTRISC